mmetsp:Transcript_434/g.1031  ORF Transcript_434/g.1031 Transcript_434/m.1031 type:complete len:272 (+) Transcript_434:703-1518(+)
MDWPESTISCTIMASQPSMAASSPTISCSRDVLSTSDDADADPDGRCLRSLSSRFGLRSTIANLASGMPFSKSTCQNSLARLTAFSSGATTTTLRALSAFLSLSAKYNAPTLIAVMLSLGTAGDRNPCICPECMSIDTSLSAPMVSSIAMVSLAAIGDLSRPLLASLRAYPQYGMTTVIVFAEDLRMVAIMSRSSMSASFKLGGHVDCTIITCLPLIFSLTLIEHSPSANLDRSMLPSLTPRYCATSFARAVLPLPAKSITLEGSASLRPL